MELSPGQSQRLLDHFKSDEYKLLTSFAQERINELQRALEDPQNTLEQVRHIQGRIFQERLRMDEHLIFFPAALPEVEVPEMDAYAKQE